MYYMECSERNVKDSENSYQKLKEINLRLIDSNKNNDLTNSGNKNSIP